MKNKKLKRILQLTAFLLSFLLFTGILYFPYKIIVEPYNSFLMNLVPDYVFSIKRIVLWGVKGEIVSLLVKSDIPGRFKTFKINGFFLHANIIPVIAVFLATFSVFYSKFREVKWWKKIAFVLVSLFVLFLTHWLHLILNCVMTTANLSFNVGSFFAEFDKEKITLFYEFLFYVRGFFEQVVRMVIPFFLWAFFCLKYIWSEDAFAA